MFAVPAEFVKAARAGRRDKIATQEKPIIVSSRVRKFEFVSSTDTLLRVGSPLSIKSLQEDLFAAHGPVARWLEILENLYVCFRISPYGSPKIRAVKKEQKLYLWDWSFITDPGARFENFVPSPLLKYCPFIQDTQGYKMELRYLRARTPIPKFFQTHLGDVKSGDPEKGRQVIPFIELCETLGLV